MVAGSIDVSGTGVFGSGLTIGGEFNMIGTADENKYFDARLGSNTLNFRGASGGGANLITMATMQRDGAVTLNYCLLYTSPSPRDVEESRMPSSA